MPINRGEALRAMLEQNPGDSFARYGLAMEYVRTGDLKTAAAEFRLLLERDPGYVPGYYHAGQTLERLGRPDDARAIYERGIEVAVRAGDDHARSELQAALDIL